jgi:Family of unknown function (DUF6459)
VTSSHLTPELDAERSSLVTPIVDYEPPPVDPAPAPCPQPSPTALRRRASRHLRPVRVVREVPPPRAAAVFADAALRCVLEVSDRRRPIAALRTLLTAPLIDAVVALGRTPSDEGAAVLRRIRVRTAEVIDEQATAAEVFGTYTRGDRVRALAARIEVRDGRWRVVALQLG